VSIEVTPAGTVQLHEPVVVTCSTVCEPTTIDVVAQSRGVEVRVNELVVTVALFASVTLTVIALLAGTPVVIPLISPVLAFIDSPVGNVPLAIANTFDPAPPEAVSDTEYGVPFVAESPVVGVVIASAPLVATLNVSVESMGANSKICA
jgi:hypothetical protein